MIIDFIDFVKSYISHHYVVCFALIALLVMLKVSINVPRRSKQFTLAAIILLFAESVAFDLELWTQTFRTLSIWRPILTAFIYSIFPVILFLIMQVTMRYRMPKLKAFLLLLPEIIAVPLYFTSQWTHLVCYYVEPNNYCGGPLSMLPYYMAAFYIIVLLLQNIFYFRKSAPVSRMITAYITVGSCFGVVLYVILEISDDYTSLFAASMVLYYLCLYIHLTRIDPLTHLSNRSSFYQEMHDKADKITVVASIDMNGLKILNDTQGHEAGDNALKAIAKILLDGSGANATAYRIGGDEFIIFFFGAKEQEANAQIADMREKIAQTEYSCAFGTAKVENKNVEDALRLADKRMYEDKALRS